MYKLPLAGQSLKTLTIFYFVVGILVSVKTRADQKIHKLKESYDHLVQRVTELQERNDKLVMSYVANLVKYS